MFHWIIGTSLRFRFLVVAIAAALVIYGTGQRHDMPVDVFPEFAPPRVEIQTEGPGMSAAEVEELITIPMEESLRGTPELAVMRSKSVVGLSSILLIFKRGTDLLHDRRFETAGWMVYSLLNHLSPFVPRVYYQNGVPVALEEVRI